MSRYDYDRSKYLHDESFCTLIMAAMRSADHGNLKKLKFAFPETWKELQARYNAPGGHLEGEK